MALVRHPLRWLRAHPTTADALLAVALTAVAVATALSLDPEDGERSWDAVGWALLVGANVPIVWRRLAPAEVMWITVGLTMMFWILDYDDDPAGLPLLVALYSVAAYLGRPRSVWHGAGAVGVGLAIIVAGILSPEEDLSVVAIPVNLVLFGAAWALGDTLRTRRANLRGLEERAAMTEAQRHAEAQRAVADERNRIARELHDVVAHSVSVMVVQASGARRQLSSADADDGRRRADEALAAIEATGRDALTEMRRMLGVLRDDETPAALAPAPALHDITRLAEHCEDAGLHVDIEMDDSAGELPAGLQLSAYRIVQESLTNSLKHAGPARATVRVRREDSLLRVEVIDDGRGAAARPDSSGAGQGQVGMRERVESFGGSLEVGPRPGGGYEVRALLPLETP